MTPAERLTEWLAIRYKGQVIKRTIEPYFNHLLAVAALTRSVITMGYEIGMCHDLLEDTDTISDDLLKALLSFGYTHKEASWITFCVVELTDVYTSTAYPGLTKNERKEQEGIRLLTICPDAQTVKYADFIYNIGWVLKYDKKHAECYLRKKHLLLTRLTGGDQNLRQQALNKIHTALATTYKNSK